MSESGKIQILLQLIDSMDAAATELEKTFASKDAARFKQARDAVLELQQKIASVL